MAKVPAHRTTTVLASGTARVPDLGADDGSDEDTAAVLAELPRPAHLVYRRLLRPRYEAQRRWQQRDPTAVLVGTLPCWPLTEERPNRTGVVGG